MIGAIVFARKNSTRLPSKVLIRLHGKTILEHIINRVERSRFLEKIIIATSIQKDDDEIVNIANKLSINFYRGSESDVLDRCYQAAKKFAIDPIIRITADDPIKDPEIIDQIISIYLNKKEEYDLVCNTLKPTFPEGLDVELMPFKTLEKVWKLATTPQDREHVTKFIYDNEKLFKIFNVTNSIDLSNIRLTLDTKEDLILFEKIFDELYPKNKNFSWLDVISYLQSNPYLMQINKNIKRSDRYRNNQN